MKFLLALLTGCLLGSAILCDAAMAQTWPAYSREIPYSGLRSAPTTSFPDQALFGGMRFDKLEWNGLGGNDRARWDMEAFVGNDYDKFFFKSEGAFDGPTQRFDEARFQALYSRMISYFFDFQVGVRHDVSPRPSRTYAVIGIEGLAPGFFEIDADAYISQKGEISGSFTGWYDLLITNRLILQPRVDLRLQLQSVPELELGRGLTDFELGARLRYEFTRNVAPYIGVSWDRKVGETASIALRNQKQPSSANFVAGVRLLW
ncbi:MAG: copper resistance protein B [Bradyrhizobium sp.]|jgi:copper resistance protein B|uniref:Copper resistance protein B n=1 Tax=Bradyrhizobium denitrificans TaxID=2734912 RepID=A0ABS5G2H7_9BRAD|nr:MULTISPECIES: copper resistance protein B [Bradyrhizobium]MBR1135279.1 copper resistance protein B [Bradyrhizobium denitrificans]MDU0955593.1 copper resistance protein B [Bradyrhizobium sp.]MDU1495661.1 copper resistance protein B [Bradyrhizobium sp.]MDU1545835.1 copper resistance protein B [Bradyrhizobium sp.]MDU1693308.1 copper resistance protein B [Bradyrhizobium sp.]